MAISFRERGARVSVIRPASSARLVDDLRRLVHYRDLFYTLSVHRVKVRYKQSALGLAWAILQPVSLMLIYTLVFSFIARMPSDGQPYALFAYSALLPWTFFASALTGATSSLVSNSALVTRVYFPREILPLTYVVAAAFDFAVACTVLGALLLYYGIPLTANALYAVPVMVVAAALATGIGLFFAAAQVRFRDVGVAVPLVLQVWMFASPVVYPLSIVPEWLRPFYLLNPMAGIVENFRRVVLEGAGLDAHSLGLSALLTVVTLVAAYLFFNRVQASMADVI